MAGLVPGADFLTTEYARGQEHHNRTAWISGNLGNLEHRTISHSDSIDYFAYLFGSLSEMAHAPALLASSLSNMGALLITLAGRQSSELPPLIFDFDKMLTTEDTECGIYYCSVARGARSLCGGRELAAEMKQNLNQ